MKKFLFSHLGELLFLLIFLPQLTWAEDIQVIAKSIVNCEAKKPFSIGAVTPDELALSTIDIDVAIALYKRKPCKPYRTFINLNASLTEPVVKSSSSKSSSKSAIKSSSSVNNKSSSMSSLSASSAGPAGPIAILSALGSTELDGNTPARAVDGNSTTRWESTWQTDPSWLTLDLGAPKALGNIDIDWEDSNAKVYAIQGSNDSNTWSDIATKTDGANYARTDSLKLSSTFRYVRIYCQERTSYSEWGYSIWEVRLTSAGTAVSVSSKASSSAKSAAPGIPVSLNLIQPPLRENGDVLPLADIGGYLVDRTDESGTMIDVVDIKSLPTPGMTFKLPFLVSETDVVGIATYDKTGVYSKRILVSK